MSDTKTRPGLMVVGWKSKSSGSLRGFADIKLPREERSRIPLMVAPEGILWVAGHRLDHRFYATTATERTVVAELLDCASPKGD